MKRLFFQPVVLLAAALCLAVSCAEPTVQLSAERAVLDAGETLQLTATAPGEVVWSSSDEKVASVHGGTVEGRSAGSAVITARAGRASASCTVEVKADCPIEGAALVWNDEFFGAALDETKWDYQLGVRDDYHGITGPRHWGNNELQYYTKEAVRLSEGELVITARREEAEDCSFTSARIITRDRYSFTYGYAEARIKLPAERGMWPAFWMLPQPDGPQSTGNVYGGWASSGEIDILEAKGREPFTANGTLHFGRGGSSTYRTGSTKLNTSIAEWHTYGVEWREDHIAWYADGAEYFRVDRADWWTEAVAKDENPAAPFDRPFYLLLNLAVGGNYDGGVRPEESFSSAEMAVDYVRVYEFFRSEQADNIE